MLAACPEPDIVVLNNRGPNPGRLDAITDSDLQLALALHYWTPVKIVQQVVPGMCERGFGRIVSITSAMVTTPRPLMVASSGARAGATAVLKAVSIDVARYNVTINCMLPERIDSPRQQQMANIDADREGITYEEARARMADTIAAKRLGRTSEFGANLRVPVQRPRRLHLGRQPAPRRRQLSRPGLTDSERCLGGTCRQAAADGSARLVSGANRRSRRLFETTKTLDSAIAAPAIIGFKNPAAASGIAATL